MTKKNLLTLTLIAGLAGLIVYNTVFYVHVTEYAILTRFGQPKVVITQPGIRFKIPFAEELVIRSRKLRLTSSKGDEFLTKDKKNIVVSWFLLWKIQDPLKYYRTVFRQQNAEFRLVDIVSSSVGAELGKVDFSGIISLNNREESLIKELEKRIKEVCLPVFGKNFGIALEDIRFTRFNFPEQNRESVFKRMRAERERIAAKYRSEGEGESIRIKARADHDRKLILAKAGRKAREVRGEGEAQAAAIYRETFSKDPEFYKFIRTLEAYDKIIDKKTTLVLPQNMELFKLLKTGEN